VNFFFVFVSLLLMHKLKFPQRIEMERAFSRLISEKHVEKGEDELVDYDRNLLQVHFFYLLSFACFSFVEFIYSHSTDIRAFNQIKFRILNICVSKIETSSAFLLRCDKVTSICRLTFGGLHWI
jgi:hypothetical protein